jgi:hypothetical protein
MAYPHGRPRHRDETQPPPRLGPRVGDDVVLRRDVLVEVARESRATPMSWRFLPSGTRARLIGWREHDDEPRAVIDVTGADKRLVAFVREKHVGSIGLL